VLHQGRIVAEGTAGQLKAGLGVGSLDEVFLALTAAEEEDTAATAGAGARYTAEVTR
jgi:hypothetical protein